VSAVECEQASLSDQDDDDDKITILMITTPTTVIITILITSFLSISAQDTVIQQVRWSSKTALCAFSGF